MKSFYDIKEHERCLVDLDTVPHHQRMDYTTRNENISKRKKLCRWCDGTGNELFSMYRQCPKCFIPGVRVEET